ncbi:diacylglycerol kinase (ATP) [Marinitoga hydrogenitolerans DSM 16785]|uniref:Diacylglycerol kinase (ATP) n=1 Tax=Marinitoga hydrogenitolerans (strain DSM 16785 / JCM 12826 / AT1271) TaxID=1122195 RepID=A0A1M4Y2I3_MARH1|nr:diacylglycerol kinase family protein [Marinitoga hydrogenitolerans]SHE99898.1 diacylglycerol kinase (ATP) [Marinitoga hydrogenitolerans DSM 16785]
MRKFSKSLSFAIKGLFEVFNTQRNFKIQTAFALGAFVLAFVLDLNESQILWITLAILMVLILETVNTLIERMMDLIHPHFSPIVGIIKDLGAAAVLIAATFSIVVAIVIFGGRIFNWPPKYGIIVGIAFIVFIIFGSRLKK